MRKAENNMNMYLNTIRYLRAFVYRLFILISPIIKIWEKKRIGKFAAISLKCQPIFIIGAPRTGSTILYQAITNQLDTLYVDNLTCLLHQNFFFGFYLSGKLFKKKSHNCFKSNHGNTNKYGLHAPSECGSFWYRWLPKDRHFIDFDDLIGINLGQIKTEISAVSNYFQKPIVFKNLNAGQRMRMLSRIYPDAKFIFIRRDPYFTAQSILKAKRKLGIPDNMFWSVMPSNVRELKKLNWPDQIIQQIFFLEKQIAEDAKLFSRENILEVNYSDFNQKTIAEISTVFGLTERQSFDFPSINIHETVSLEAPEEKLLREAIKKMDWSKTNVE